MKKIAEFADAAGLGEVELTGTAVSRGFSVGGAVRLHGAKRQFARVSLPAESIGHELKRLDLAIETTAAELDRLAGDGSSLAAGSRSIFDAHNVILAHSSFVPDIKETIAGENVNAEWAIIRVTDDLTSKLRKAADARVREKSLDVQDVAERLLNALSPEERRDASFWAGAVIVAPSIRPSTMVELSRYQPKAIVTEHGGWTSHAFIMAREMRIPAVTSLRGLCRNIADGDTVLVDGFSGRVVVRPADATVRSATASQPAALVSTSEHVDLTATPTTVDHREIVLRANVEHFGSSEELRLRGANGIGLLRSEYLFDLKPGFFPTEDVQYAAYRKVAEKCVDLPVRIRTFDLNAEQISLNLVDRDKNPSLGLRAIRLSLAHEADFRAQARAILRASRRSDLSIILPMVSGPEDIVRARAIIDAESDSLAIADDERPHVGVMIEVPSAVLMIDEILKLVDCVCLGTNDLVQYLLAVDRDNESVAGWYQTLHPAVLRAVKSVLAAAELADIPAVICGEMAGSSFYTPLLIGMGAREFSMNLNAIGPVRRVIGGISYEESLEAAAEALRSTDAHVTEELLRSFYREKWPHLFDSSDTGTLNGFIAGA